ncbi:MAG: hypothetical protein QGD88_13105 [Anaerolineae bacterium]|nr:hypothetical protein [Anaerolineae bacterium]
MTEPLIVAGSVFGGQVTFQATCSVCHAIPDPQLHTSVEWPVVVERMKQNMVILGKTVPNEATIREIVGYLQRHAKDSD